MKRRTLAIFLTLCLLLTTLPTAAFAANSGTCGDGVKWSLSNGKLTISGKGDMYDYDEEDAPWTGQKITSVVINDGVTYLGAFAFYECNQITSISIPKSVENMSLYTFDSCPALKTITVNSGNQVFASVNGVLFTKDKTVLLRCPQAFSGKYTVPSGTQAIYHYAFDSCEKLTAVSMPDSLKEIGSQAFAGCTSLGDVTIPKGVNRIYELAFVGCAKMNHIWVSADNSTFAHTSDGVLMSKEMDTLFAIPCGRTGTYTVPNKVLRICAYAGFLCNISRLVIEHSLNSIGEYAFALCPNLKSVEAAKCGCLLESGCFAGCSKLTTVSVGSCNFYSGAFADCTSLSNVTMGEWACIQGGAFTGCTALTSIILPDLISLNSGSFYGCPNLRTVVYTASTLNEFDDCADDFFETDNLTIYHTENFPDNYTFGKAKEVLLTPSKPFYDVQDGRYYDEPVAWAVKNDITSGLTDYSFGPNESCTRAQVVAFLWRACGSPEPTSKDNPFVDVPAWKYYAKAVLWAAENGITKGTDATHFSPEEPVSRAQFVTFLYRAKGSPAASVQNPFDDVMMWQFYAKAVLWAVENGITKGESATVFGVNDPCSRGQVVTFLFRTFGSDIEPEGTVDYGPYEQMR